MSVSGDVAEEDTVLGEPDDVLLSGSGLLRVDAIIQSSDRKWLRRQWIKRGGRTGSAMRWKAWRVEPARIYLHEKLN